MPQKIRKQFPINLEKRSNVTKGRINKWLDVQSNYTASVISIIENTIERFGYVDVTEHEISSKLYGENKVTQPKITATNLEFPIHDAKEEIKTETSVAENYSETTISVENENQKLFIKINPENRVLLIRDGSGKELSYKF